MGKKILVLLFLTSSFLCSKAQSNKVVGSTSDTLSAIDARNRANKFYSSKNYTEAFKWYQQSANNGNADAMASLGYMYGHALGVKADNALAVKWYLKSSENGNARGKAYMGSMYENGLGVNKSLQEAFTWYTKAATAGNANAMFKLANMFENGLGVNKDLAQALKWYKAVAAKYIKL